MQAAVIGALVCAGPFIAGAADGNKAPRDAAATERAGVVLDWPSSYWRYHLTFRRPTYTTPFTDRRGRVYEHLQYQRGWHIAPMRGHVRSPDAAADWMKPDFNDSSWARERRPEHGSEGWSYDPIVQVKRLRGRFEVPHPGRVAGLRLEIEYVGGVVVYLNGHEVARGHLPAGEPTGDVAAEGYPQEAYHEPGARWMMGHEGNRERPPTPKALALRQRRLAVDLDTDLLRAGINVVALSFHQASYHPIAHRWSWECGGMGGNTSTWPHLTIRVLTLRCTPPGSALGPARPGGVQVWAEDIHRRVVNRDFGEVSARSSEQQHPPVIRLVGARNGTHSGQVVVGTSDRLVGLTARMSDLVRLGGPGRIAADAAQVRYGVGMPLESLRESRFNKHNQFLNTAANRLLERYIRGGFRFTSHRGRVRPSKEVLAHAKAIALFDHLAERPPREVAADTCQPIWLTVRVPKEASPGHYRGTLTIRASGDGRRQETGSTGSMPPCAVQVRLMVFDWTLPDGRNYATFLGLQHSLWGPARHYKVPAWSPDHWRLLERSIEMLAEVGNDIVVLPLVVNGEVGNDESLVPWVRKGHGYEYDWGNLDRYLDLVAKHWGRGVAVVGEVGWAPRGSRGWYLVHEGVTVVENGKKGTLALPEPGTKEWTGLFPPFARAVREHLKARGFENLHWGWFYDGRPAALLTLVEALAEAVPGVGWARASHTGNRRRPFPKTSRASVTLDMRIRGFPRMFNRAGEPVSNYGWRNAGDVLFPRHASEVMALGRFESPMSMRWLIENALVNGAAGVGRIGADYWPPFAFRNWYHPFVNFLFYPGPHGAESSVRFEALREGVQETEARIFLERTGKDKMEPARSVLAERIRCLGVIPTGPAYPLVAEYYAGWQERSWDLYAAAAAAGGTAPDDATKVRFFGTQ